MAKETKEIIEELENVTIVEGENLKKATSVEGGKLKNVITIEGEDMKKVKLITSDKVIFEVEMSIVKEMEIVQSFLDSRSSDNSVAIPLPNVTSRYLRLIINYSVNHYRLSEAGNLEELKLFKEQFVKELNNNELKELLVIANYLDMKNLFAFMCTSIANNIKNKNVDFVRDLFGLINDYSPYEEEAYRQENEWAFQNINRD